MKPAIPMLALLALVLGAAAPASLSMPIPPMPPAHPPVDELAPVPNPDVREPLQLSASEVTLRPQFYRADRPDTSRGFTPGSRYQANDERKPLQTPGLRLTVPLQ